MNQFKGGFILPFPKNNHFENENNCNNNSTRSYNSLLYRLITKIIHKNVYLSAFLTTFSSVTVIVIFLLFLSIFRTFLLLHCRSDIFSPISRGGIVNFDGF